MIACVDQIRYRAVQDAKEVLGDQVLRAIYDAYGHQVDTDFSWPLPNSCTGSCNQMARANTN